METTATQMAAEARLNGVRYGIDRLLHRLRKLARAYPMKQDDTMPEHDVVFVEGVDGGPTHEILDAMVVAPELWLQAIPKGLVIVPRARLTSLGMDAGVVSLLEKEAAHSIGVQAGEKLRKEQEDRPHV